MAGVFIDVELDDSFRGDAELAKKLEDACPVDIYAARDGGVDVLDDGPGIAAGEEEAVFERFHRGSAGRRGPSGTGLGLPIARQLVRRWGGDVTLARRDGGGTAARLALPPAGRDGHP